MTPSSDVPFEVRIWDAAQCAEYLGNTKPYFLRVRQFSEGFPKQLAMSAKRQPRWSAKAVTDWALDRKLPETIPRHRGAYLDRPRGGTSGSGGNGE